MATITSVRTLIVLSALVLCFSQAHTRGYAAFGENLPDEVSHETPTLRAVGYVTWWYLDALGYHPAIMLKLVNNSGRDLTGQMVRFQVQFLDRQSGQVVGRARREYRSLFASRQRAEAYVLLRCPRPFALGIDSNEWPAIECKVMTRVGDVGDEGTETLVVTHLDQVTMTEDDAREQISKMHDFTPLPTRSVPRPVHKSVSAPPKPEKPLTAIPGVLKSNKSKPPAAIKSGTK